MSNKRSKLVSKARALLAIGFPVFLACMVRAYTQSSATKLKSSVGGKFGDANPVKPDYRAEITTDRRVFALRTMNIDVKFSARNALSFTNGPFYIVVVENRYSQPQGPAAGDGNYFPGHFNEFGWFVKNWILDFPPLGECTIRFNYSAVPSWFFTDQFRTRPPNASAKFTSTAVLPGA